MEQQAKAPFKRVQIEAVIIRADGTQESLGVVSDSRWGRFSLRKFLADRRIRNLNRLHGKEE